MKVPHAPGHRQATPKPKLKQNRHPCTWEGCHRMFACPHNVRQHIREAHTGERPYACEICAAAGKSKAFKRPGVLNRHLRLVHHMVVETNRARKESSDRSVQRTQLVRCDTPMKPHDQEQIQQTVQMIEPTTPVFNRSSFESTWSYHHMPAEIDINIPFFGEHKTAGFLNGHDLFNLSYDMPSLQVGSSEVWAQMNALVAMQPPAPTYPIHDYHNRQLHPNADHMLIHSTHANNTIPMAWSQGAQSYNPFAGTGLPSLDSLPRLQHSRNNSSEDDHSRGTIKTEDLFSSMQHGMGWMM